MINLLRVDNRLIHGQVVESWLPTLKVRRVLVADDEAAGSALVRAAMGLAVPPTIDVVIEPLEVMDFPRLASDGVSSLLLVREVAGVSRAFARGVGVVPIQLGNIHFATGRRQATPSVFLSPEELEALKMLHAQGCPVEVRAVPSEKPLSLQELVRRLPPG
ncbi:MAG TPA: PTS sugar transporter subunit IIB [Myxococcaceae bacterium]|nr:PTS sugar transporter subunit IIB [Myxococcaceae bacterium]